ncbi:nicotinamide N-methyltransferase-like [Gastrophryne carolinensis]
MAVPYTSQETYVEEFNPVVYLQTFYDVKNRNPFEEWTTFALKVLHDTFIPGYIEGDTLIDVGSGPVIYHLISACEVFNNIIASDLLEGNMTELRKWLNNEPDSFDWTPYIKKVCEMEGNRQSCEEKAEKLRSKVKQVIKCDVLKNNIFEPLTLAPADCLLCCLCLEAPCKDMDSFCNVLKKFRDLINPGGHLIVMSMLNSKGYCVGQKRFNVLYMTEEALVKAFKDAEYEILEMKSALRKDLSTMEICKQKGYYFVLARKPKS